MKAQPGQWNAREADSSDRGRGDHPRNPDRGIAREGYVIDSVATAAAATTCLEAIFYELVVADWRLPDGDGVTVADTAAQLGSKTLIVTGHLSDLPPGVADRHQLRSKKAGHADILAAVREAIGSPDEKRG